MRVTGSITADPERGGMAFSDAREANISVNVGCGRPWDKAVPVNDGANPPVPVSSLMNRRITKPCAAPVESLSGILPSKELLCAYPRQ